MTESGRFAHLLAPGSIGPLALRNRILMCPMGDNLGRDDGTVSDRQLAYFEARARGGAALLLVGSVAVGYPSGTYDPRQLGASDDRFLPGLAALADRAHRHGARIAAQLVHDGPNSLNDIAQGRPLLVPSVPSRPTADPLAQMVTGPELTAMMRPFTAPTARVEVRVADEDDLALVIAQFADAAVRCVRAGFDAVEIHAGHGYLIDAFLSPATNRRTDRWGGAVEDRARLLCSVLAAVRARIGDEHALWCRLNGEERLREGETVADARVVAPLAVAAGSDAIHVTAYADPGVAIGVTAAHTPHEPGALVALAAAVKEVVPVPVITFGRLEPDDAERALAAGQADFVAMGRKLLADPDLPRRLAEGRVADVRPCIYRYRCIGNIFVGDAVACVVNPHTGHEDELRIEPAAVSRRVVVIGGGPAGLEAARLLAARGHRVELWEAGEQLGGRLSLAALVDPVLDQFLGWLRRGVEQAGVSLALGRAATPDAVAAAEPDAVVVATGGRWPPSLDAVAAWLADDDGSVGARVTVLGGGSPGLGIAGLCARRGRQVTVVERSGVAGADLGLPGRFRVVHELREAGVELRLGEDSGPDPDGAGTVIDTAGVRADRSLADALAGLGVPVHVAGDCAEPDGIEGAMAAAVRVARAIN